MTLVEAMGTAPDGTTVERVVLQRAGTTVSILTWGARLQEFRLGGIERSLILGSAKLEPYFGSMRYFGAIVGPVANRIAKGQLKVCGRPHRLELNEFNKTTLHGGPKGFSDRNWQIVHLKKDRVCLRLADQGLSGFPGNIDTTVLYQLEDDGALTIEITGHADALTWFGPAFHGYWALDGKPDISQHLLTVEADHYLPVDQDKLPLDHPNRVAGTQFDYRQPRRPAAWLDHNFCLCQRQGTLRPACRLSAGELTLTVETTEVGLQIYAGGGLDTGFDPGHTRHPYGANAGIAIEPQFWPDTPNHPSFPSSALAPGQIYRQVSRFRVTQ